MKRLCHFLIFPVVIFICISCLAGCFDRRELDTLGIVMGVAIDKAATEGDTEITVQMANPTGKSDSKSKGKAAKEDESSGDAAKPYINVSDTGKNTNYIIREMQHKMSRRIYVAHSQVMVIGKDQAKVGVRDCLDFFARAAETRMTVYMFVAKHKAKDILEHQPEFEKMPSVELAKIIKDQKITSNTPIVSEFEFVKAIISKTTAPVAPMVEVVENDDKTRLKVSGCAVFKGSRMVGEFDDKQSRGLLFVQGKVKTGVLLVTVQDVTATIEIREAKSKVEPILYTNGMAEFNVEIEATLGLGDQSGTFNLSDPENEAEILNASQTEIKNEIQGAVDKSKELDADVFGFGEHLNRKYPDQWKDMKDRWDELYKNIKVNITVKAKGDGSGRIIKPLLPGRGMKQI